MKRTFSKEFKVKACELAIKDGIKHAVVAEKMGINKIMLYRWISEYETYGEEAFVGAGHQRSEDAELRKLRKENERLKMENESEEYIREYCLKAKHYVKFFYE